MENLFILLLLITISWLVSGRLADSYAARKHNKQELKQLIENVLNYSFDIERENYIETYGEEYNNYLMLDSDLELHIDQEENEHIYKTLHKLQRLVSNTTL